MLDKKNFLNKKELILFVENQIRICSQDPNQERYSDRVFFLNAFLEDINYGRFDCFDNVPKLYLEKI